MNQSALIALKLTTVADIISFGIQTDKKNLIAALEELEKEPATKANYKVNYCMVCYIFLHWAEDISNLRKSVAQIRGTVDEPVIWKELEDSIMELLILQEEFSHLEDSFRPYLHCPAVDTPEHSN